MNKIIAFAPATIANFSVGFDVLGMALDSIGDHVELCFNHSSKNKITAIEGGKNLPMEVHKNCCSVVIQKMQEQLGKTEGVDIRIKKGFQSGSGLGSSSASSAAAAFAYNELLGKPFSEQQLVAFAAEGERVACGAAHADNVAPAIMGGLVLVRSHEPIDVVRLPVPKGLYAVLLFPNVKINTADSRDVMKKNISLHNACQQWANLGAFVASLYQNDLALLARSLQDLVAEPVRSLFIPQFKSLKQTALEHRALGLGISGSGPSVFALAKTKEEAKKIEQAMLKLFEGSTINTLSFVEALEGNQGARIVEKF